MKKTVLFFVALFVAVFAFGQTTDSLKKNSIIIEKEQIIDTASFEAMLKDKQIETINADTLVSIDSSLICIVIDSIAIPFRNANDSIKIDTNNVCNLFCSQDSLKDSLSAKFTFDSLKVEASGKFHLKSFSLKKVKLNNVEIKTVSANLVFLIQDKINEFFREGEVIIWNEPKNLKQKKDSVEMSIRIALKDSIIDFFGYFEYECFHPDRMEINGKRVAIVSKTLMLKLHDQISEEKKQVRAISWEQGRYLDKDSSTYVFFKDSSATKIKKAKVAVVKSKKEIKKISKPNNSILVFKENSPPKIDFGLSKKDIFGSLTNANLSESQPIYVKKGNEKSINPSGKKFFDFSQWNRFYTKWKFWRGVIIFAIISFIIFLFVPHKKRKSKQEH